MLSFLRGCSPERCCETFDKIVKQFFSSGRRPTTTVSKFRSYVKWWLNDAKYNSTSLETHLKDVFGAESRVFGRPVEGISGTKVAVTATSISDASTFLLANYNTLPETSLGESKPSPRRSYLNMYLGYHHVREMIADSADEPHIWEA